LETPTGSFTRLYDGAVADRLRSGAAPFSDLISAGETFPVKKDQIAFGCLHPASRYAYASGKITLSTPISVAKAASDSAVYMVSVQLWDGNQNNRNWIQYFADAPDLGSGPISQLTLQIPVSPGSSPPATGIARIAIVVEKTRLSIGYGYDQSQATSAADPAPSDWIDVIEADESDCICIAARLLSPGPVLDHSTGNPVPPSIGPANGCAFTFLSSIVPPMPQMVRIESQQWNIHYSWKTTNVVAGADVRIYDQSSTFEFELQPQLVPTRRSLAFAPGPRPLAAIFADLRVGNWNTMTAADAQQVKDYLLSQADPIGTPSEEGIPIFLDGDQILKGEAYLATNSGNTCFLQDPNDARRRETFQWRFRVRALENYDKGDLYSVLSSDWTPWSDWIAPLPLKPTIISPAPSAVVPIDPLTSPPSNRLTVQFKASNRTLNEFNPPAQPPGSAAGPAPILYRLLVRRATAAPRLLPSTKLPEVFPTVMVADRVCNHQMPTSDFPTLEFTYLDSMVAPSSRVPAGFSYSYELEIHLCKYLPDGSIQVASKSEVAMVSLPPETSCLVQGWEPQFGRPVMHLFTADQSSSSFLDRLQNSGWRQQRCSNIFRHEQARGARVFLPCDIVSHERIEAGTLLRLAGADRFSFALVEKFEFDPESMEFRSQSEAVPVLYLA
jgi:hypothetical protein